jgi:hypothetical protein
MKYPPPIPAVPTSATRREPVIAAREGRIAATWDGDQAVPGISPDTSVPYTPATLGGFRGRS